MLLNTFNKFLPMHFDTGIDAVFNKDVAMTIYKHCLMTAVADSNRSYETAEFLDKLRTSLRLKLEDCLMLSRALVSASWGLKWEPFSESEQRAVFGLAIKASLADGDLSKEESEIIFKSLKALDFTGFEFLKQNIKSFYKASIKSLVAQIREDQLVAVLTLVLLIVMADGVITQGEHEVVTEIFKAANMPAKLVDGIISRVEIDTGYKLNINLASKAS